MSKDMLMLVLLNPVSLLILSILCHVLLVKYVANRFVRWSVISLCYFSVLVSLVVFSYMYVLAPSVSNEYEREPIGVYE